jgi:hypothetical protein
MRMRKIRVAAVIIAGAGTLAIAAGAGLGRAPAGGAAAPASRGAATPVAAAPPAPPENSETAAPAPTAPVPVVPASAPAAPAVPAAGWAQNTPGADAGSAAFRSRDGHIEFRVPRSGDPEWADYQEMLQHPSYRSSGTGTRGFAMPYDPEWRALVHGRRDAAAVDLELQGGAARMEDLAHAILESLRARDVDRLLELHLDRGEFLGICWPEFPQSRPYLKIPEAEAWSFQQSKCAEAALSGVRTWGGRAWVLDGIGHTRSTAYRNFTLHEGVTVRAIDGETGRLEALDIAPVVVERNGRFKVFVYGE